MATAQALDPAFPLREALNNTFQILGLEIQRETVMNLTGRVLYRQTGRLATSVGRTSFARVSKEARGLALTLTVAGPAAYYGKIWEETGHRAFTIVPKNAKALAIPAFQLIGKARGGKRLASQFGGVFGLQREGKSKQFGKTGFIFRKRAHIKAAAPKPWLRPAAEAQLAKAPGIFYQQAVSPIEKSLSRVIQFRIKT